MRKKFKKILVCSLLFIALMVCFLGYKTNKNENNNANITCSQSNDDFEGVSLLTCIVFK